MCLYSWPQMCMPGQYQFPFSFTLPVGLPGSFEYEERGHVRHGAHEYTYIKAKIKYRIRAMCVVPGMFKANIRHKVSWSVGQLVSWYCLASFEASVLLCLPPPYLPLLSHHAGWLESHVPHIPPAPCT